MDYRKYLCAAMPKPVVALVEIYESHSETLYSQYLFLAKGGYDVHLLVSARHKDLVESFGCYNAIIYTENVGNKGLSLWQSLWKIRRQILSLSPDLVIFNTAHSTPLRNLLLFPFPSKIKFVGTLHGVNKLEGSVTQNLISRRIKSYFLLNDYMLQKAKSLKPQLKFAVYYPIFFPENKSAVSINKPADETWVAIPGTVEYKRRDYLKLAAALGEMKGQQNLKFILLGNSLRTDGDGAALKKTISEAGLTSYFKFFDGFVNQEEFDAYLKLSDCVMPLTHPVNEDLKKYAQDQISGAFNIAFGFKKPLLMQEFYRRYDDFSENALFYELGELPEALCNLKDSLQHMPSLYQNKKWNFDYQQQQYLALLKG